MLLGMANDISHLSNSSLDDWFSCQFRFWLRRIVGIDEPRPPAWYFVGGSTGHSVTEKWEVLHG
jgi:hypothetical protein